ncbi:hypothetical protein WCLP8_1880020 [uncultured Gammaproteobacteria bacterium]
MSTSEHNIQVRLSVVDGDQVRAQLVGLGDAGQQALESLVEGGEAASDGLAGLGDAAQSALSGLGQAAETAIALVTGVAATAQAVGSAIAAPSAQQRELVDGYIDEEEVGKAYAVVLEAMSRRTAENTDKTKQGSEEQAALTKGGGTTTSADVERTKVEIAYLESSITRKGALHASLAKIDAQYADTANYANDSQRRFTADLEEFQANTGRLWLGLVEGLKSVAKAIGDYFVTPFRDAFSWLLEELNLGMNATIHNLNAHIAKIDRELLTLKESDPENPDPDYVVNVGTHNRRGLLEAQKKEFLAQRADLLKQSPVAAAGEKKREVASAYETEEDKDGKGGKEDRLEKLNAETEALLRQIEAYGKGAEALALATAAGEAHKLVVAGEEHSVEDVTSALLDRAAADKLVQNAKDQNAVERRLADLRQCRLRHLPRKPWVRRGRRRKKIPRAASGCCKSPNNRSNVVSYVLVH